MQAAQSGVAISSSGKIQSDTNQFFVELSQNVNVVSKEQSLVDFLFNLGSGNSLIRVRDLGLQPDPPRQQLMASIKLVASYPKASCPQRRAAPPPLPRQQASRRRPRKKKPSLRKPRRLNRRKRRRNAPAKPPEIPKPAPIPAATRQENSCLRTKSNRENHISNPAVSRLRRPLRKFRRPVAVPRRPPPATAPAPHFYARDQPDSPERNARHTLADDAPERPRARPSNRARAARLDHRAFSRARDTRPSGPASASPVPAPGEQVIAPSPASTNTPADELIPPGMLDLRGANLDQMLTLYADLVNKTILRAANLGEPKFTLTAKTQLTRREAIAGDRSDARPERHRHRPNDGEVCQSVSTSRRWSDGRGIQQAGPN